VLEDWLVGGHCRHFVSPMLAVMQAETCVKKRASGEERAELRASAKKRVPCPEVPFTVVDDRASSFEGGGSSRGFLWRCRHDGVPRCVVRRTTRPAARTVHLSVVRTISSRSSDRTPGRCLVRMARREALGSR